MQYNKWTSPAALQHNLEKPCWQRALSALSFWVSLFLRTRNYNSRTRASGLNSSPKQIFVSISQSCLTLCDPMDCSPPDFSVHVILQARILECIAISFSRVSSRPRVWTWISHIAGRLFTDWATRENKSPYFK